MQKSKKPRENQKKQKTNIPELLSVDPISKLLEYWFFWFSRGCLDFCIFTFARVLEYWFFWFFWFSRGFFWIFAFLLLQESWNIVFFWFFWFSRGFFDFWIFAFARVLEYCFSLGFLVFSRFFSFSYDIVKPQVQIPIKHAKR